MMTRTFDNVRSLSDYFCFWAAFILVTSVSQHLSQPLCRTATLCSNASAAIVKSAVSSPRCWSDLHTKQQWQLAAWFQQWLCTSARRAPDDRQFFLKKIKINCSSPSAIIWAFLNLESRGNERTTQTSELVLLFLWNIVLLCKIEPVFPTHPCVH